MADDLDIAIRSAAAGIVGNAPAGLDVLILLPRFGSGGASKVTCLLASELCAQGLEAAVATIGPCGGVTRPLLDPRVATYSLSGLGGSGRGLFASLAALPSLVAAIRRHRPAVLLSAGNHANLLAAAAHRLAGSPGTALAIKITNPILRAHHRRLWRWLKGGIYRWMFRRADAVLLLSPEDHEQVAAIAPSALDKARVVANPYLGPAPTRPAGGPARAGPPTVLSVGRLAKQKNLELLLTAMAGLAARPWRLQVLGSGKQLVALQALAERLGIAERVEFLGYVADPSPYYRSARLLAISSRWEGLPAVAIEALAAGCPVVATDCSPALTRILRNPGAGLVTPCCATAFGRAIDEALEWQRPAPPPCVLDYAIDLAALSHRQALGPWLDGRVSPSPEPARPGRRRRHKNWPVAVGSVWPAASYARRG